jgi:DeoR/GlpR family transcriptional regulator of sugar metabolism
MDFINDIQPERIEKIIKIANENKFITVEYLCTLITASPSTIRRDLRYLEENGIIKRFHGGASIQKHEYVPFTKREKLNIEEKNIIAREAVKLIKDNSTVILDSGSTVLNVAFHLGNMFKENLTIITPSINIAQYLIDKNVFKVILSGGLFNRGSSSLLGVLAVETLNKLRADMVIMSCETVSSNMEIMYPELEIIQVRKAVINSATYKVLVVDSSKFGRISLSSLGEIDIFDMVITDSKIQDEYINEIKKRNLKLVITK